MTGYIIQQLRIRELLTSYYFVIYREVCQNSIDANCTRL